MKCLTAENGKADQLYCIPASYLLTINSGIEVDMFKESENKPDLKGMKKIVRKVIESHMGRDLLSFEKAFKISGSFFQNNDPFRAVISFLLSLLNTILCTKSRQVRRQQKGEYVKGAPSTNAVNENALFSVTITESPNVLPISHQIRKLFITTGSRACWVRILFWVRLRKDKAEPPMPFLLEASTWSQNHCHIFRFCNGRPLGISR